MSEQTGQPDHRCTNCGRPKSEHRLANYADGAFVGEAFTVCPTAVFSDTPMVRCADGWHRGTPLGGSWWRCGQCGYEWQFPKPKHPEATR